VKFDGWRAQAIKTEGRVRFYSRHGMEFTGRLQQLESALRNLCNTNFVIDGELVALDDTGTPDFYAVPTALSRGTIAFCMFDVLHLGKRDTRQLPLVERKQLLADLVHGKTCSNLTVCDAFHDGDELLVTCERFGLEGVVSKRRDAPYRSGRSPFWIKVKCRAWRNANRERWRLFSSP
jgi:bifunctional non-homologous end joining protein LigD